MKEALPWAYFLVSFPYLNSESLNTVRRLTLVQAVALVQVQHSEECYLSYHHVSSLAAVNFGLLQQPLRPSPCS